MHKFQVIIGMAFTLFSLHAEAAKDFKKIESCGSATAVSGTNCSDLKVEFKFDGCQLKSEPQSAKKIICSKKNAKARFQDGDFRYEAEFSKSEDGWGGTNWKQVGKVNQWQKKTNTPVAAKVKSPVVEAREAPAAAPAPASPKVAPAPTPEASAATSTPFKYSAFFDFRYTKLSAHDDPNVPNANAESGFGLEDGAFYANYDKDKLSVVFDLAFRRAKDSDTTSPGTSATIPNESSNGNFSLGLDKSQLYLKYKVISDLVFDLGQFDTPFGVEVNDSKDRVFGKTGLVYDYTLPVTHAGAMLEYSIAGVAAKVFGANPNNKGSNGTSTSGDEKTEYGATLGYSNDYLRGQVGYLSRSIARAKFTTTNLDYGNRSLLDASLGTTLGAFSLDLEYNRISDPNKNTLTPNDSTDLEKAAEGMLALATYKIIAPLQIGARYEQVKNDPTAASLEKVRAWGGSIHYKLTNELELRGEYIGYKFTHLTTPAWRDSRVSFGTVLTL